LDETEDNGVIGVTDPESEDVTEPGEDLKDPDSEDNGVSVFSEPGEDLNE